MNGNKLYELTINENGIRFRHANPNPLSASQKFTIIMTIAGCVTFCATMFAFFSLLH